MTVPSQENTIQAQENKPNDKELNFRALEAKYQRQLELERSEKERLAKELEQKARLPYKDNEEEDDDAEPYVDHKKLKREQARFGQQIKQETQTEIQKAVQLALHEERKQNWIKSNPDFFEVLQHADKFAQEDPELAESILEMPDTFERQKLVYRNIKSKGLHKPQDKQSSIQNKVDANRKSPYYQPSGVGSAPYASNGDFSPSGQKNAYEQMQKLKAQLRI